MAVAQWYNTQHIILRSEVETLPLELGERKSVQTDLDVLQTGIGNEP